MIFQRLYQRFYRRAKCHRNNASMSLQSIFCTISDLLFLQIFQFTVCHHSAHPRSYLGNKHINSPAINIVSISWQQLTFKFPAVNDILCICLTQICQQKIYKFTILQRRNFTMFFEKIYKRGGVNRISFLYKICTLLMMICIFAGINYACTSIESVASSTGESYKAGLVTTSSGKLNVRSSPSVSASVKTQLVKDSYITLVSKSGSWWYVRYNESSYGYCSAQYITVKSEASAYVSTQSTKLNIRSNSSTSSTIRGQLPKNSPVIILKTSGDFYQVLYNGTYIGYAHSDYITPFSSNNPGSNPDGGSNSGNNSSSNSGSNSATFQLNIPSYKQYDSRWNPEHSVYLKNINIRILGVNANNQ